MLLSCCKRTNHVGLQTYRTVMNYGYYELNFSSNYCCRPIGLRLTARRPISCSLNLYGHRLIESSCSVGRL